MGAGSEATPWGGPSSLLTHPLTPAEDASSKQRQPAQHGPVRALADQGDVWHRPCSPEGHGVPAPRGPGPRMATWRGCRDSTETPSGRPGAAEKLRASRGPREATACAADTPRGVPCPPGKDTLDSGAIPSPATPQSLQRPLPTKPSIVPVGKGRAPGSRRRARKGGSELGGGHAAPSESVCPSARLPAAHTTALPCPRAADAGASCALVRAVCPPCLVDRSSHSASKVSF